MVGVPGRSKGCNTCIRRKIKCDQGTPSCGNCLKSNRPCAGYLRKRGYVFSSDVSLQDSDLQHLNEEQSTVYHHGRWKAKKTPARRSTSAAVETPASLAWASPASSPASNPMSPSESLLSCRVSNVIAHRQQLHCIFFDSFMPSEGSSGIQFNTEVTGNWLIQLRGEAIDSPALGTSISAYAVAQIGRSNGNASLIQRSREMYNRSLEQLREALGNSRTRLADETLAACMALSVYELTESPRTDGSAYTTHLTGAMKLLQARGPDANTTPLAHSLFLGLRRQTVLGSLLHHRDTFLSHPEWRERPWRLFPKNALDACIDSLFDLSKIQRRWDEVSQAEDRVSIIAGCDELLGMCSGVDSGLQEWYKAFNDSWGPLHWPTHSKLKGPHDGHSTGKLFPISTWFSSFGFAYMLTTYWSAVMTVNHILMHIYVKLAAIDPSNAGFACEHRQISITMMNNICQSTEYLVQPVMSRGGMTVALAMLRGVMACLEGDAELYRETAWVEENMEIISKRLNLSMKGALWQ